MCLSVCLCVRRMDNVPPKAVLFLQAVYIPEIQKKALYSAALQMYIGLGSLGVLGDWSVYWPQVAAAVKNARTPNDVDSLVKNVQFLDNSTWVTPKSTDVRMYQTFLSYLKSQHVDLLQKCPNLSIFKKKYPKLWKKSVDWTNPGLSSFEYHWKAWSKNNPAKYSELSDAGKKSASSRGINLSMFYEDEKRGTKRKETA